MASGIVIRNECHTTIYFQSVYFFRYLRYLSIYSNVTYPNFILEAVLSKTSHFIDIYELFQILWFLGDYEKSRKIIPF